MTSRPVIPRPIRLTTGLGTLAIVTLLAGGCQVTPEESERATAQVSTPEITRLLRNNDCFKCHTIDREKDGPSWRSVADKYRDKPDAEERLFQHLTTAPIIELKGEPEEHKQMDSMQVQDVRKISRWIVSL